MRDFYDLTPKGRVRRLRSLAWAALADYDLSVTRMRLLSWEWNTVFRLDTTDGEKLVLRIGRPNMFTPEEIRSEMMWTEALHRDTGLYLPAPIHTRTGDLLTTAQVPGVPEPRHCVVFTWVPGVDLDDRLTPETYAATGELMAQMHVQAATWSPPTGFQIPVNDTIYHPKDPDRLLKPPYVDRLTSTQRELVGDAVARVKETQARLWGNGSPPRVIHHDLHMWNVKVVRNRVFPIDFEDLVWGHPVQDIGLAFYYIQDRPDRDALQAAFRQGYERLLPWPKDEDIETFVIRRTLDFLNYFVGSTIPEEQAFFQQYLVRVEERLRRATLG